MARVVLAAPVAILSVQAPVQAQAISIRTPLLAGRVELGRCLLPAVPEAAVPAGADLEAAVVVAAVAVVEGLVVVADAAAVVAVARRRTGTRSLEIASTGGGAGNSREACITRSATRF